MRIRIASLSQHPSAALRVWINTPCRNADTNPATCDTPDAVIPVSAALPPFDPNRPSYVKYTVSAVCPYNLISAGPGGAWKKLNLDQLGERWLVAVLDWNARTSSNWMSTSGLGVTRRV